jgi:hypothetical protein
MKAIIIMALSILSLASNAQSEKLEELRLNALNQNRKVAYLPSVEGGLVIEYSDCVISNNEPRKTFKFSDVIKKESIGERIIPGPLFQSWQGIAVVTSQSSDPGGTSFYIVECFPAYSICLLLPIN